MCRRITWKGVRSNQPKGSRSVGVVGETLAPVGVPHQDSVLGFGEVGDELNGEGYGGAAGG